MIDQLNSYDIDMLVELTSDRRRKQLEAEWIYRQTRKRTAISNVLESTGKFLIDSGKKLQEIA